MDYAYIKNYYRLIAIEFNRQKELDADPKEIQQIELVGQLRKLNADNNNDESTFILTVLEKIKVTRLKISQGSVTVL